MIQHRGIKARTVERYERLIEKMLPGLGSNPTKYDAALVRQVLLKEVKQLTLAYAKTYVTALRAFLRFLAVHGRCRHHLDRAVPTLPEWRLSALPRYLEPDDIDRMIASCDLDKPFGVRDRAILFLLVRLGLRAGDIMTMRLGDIDWEEGTVRVLGKGRKEVCLPLAQDAGEALIEYLDKVRPTADTDRVFLCINAPVRPLGNSSSVSSIVRLALQRAGIKNAPSKGRAFTSPFGGNFHAAFRGQSRCDCVCASTSVDGHDRLLCKGRRQDAKQDRTALAGGCTMLVEHINRYIELHQSLGFKFRTQAYLLRHFARFAELRNDTIVRSETVVGWASEAPSAAQRRLRLLVVRRFAQSLQAEDDRNEVPPANAFGRPTKVRRLPHIYSPDEIRRLLRAAAELTPKGSLRPVTYVTLFSLLVSTGIRISEALSLQLDDLTSDGLLIRHTKFRKSRLVPLHATARKGLDGYITRRSQASHNDDSLFISMSRTRLAYPTVIATFLDLIRSIGLRGKPGTSGPCIHDFRHTFAVRSLEACTGGRDEIARHILALSTCLGHAHVSDTYYYLQATPKLLEETARAGEALFRGGAA